MLVDGNSTKLIVQNGCPTDKNVEIENQASGVHFKLNSSLLYTNEYNVYFQCELVLCNKDTSIDCKKFSVSNLFIFIKFIIYYIYNIL